MVLTINGLVSVSTPQISQPQGRISPTTGVAVPVANVAAAGTVFYALYNGNFVPLWNGSSFIWTPFTELSNVLANSAVGNAGPAAGAASKVYDLFVWNNAGTPTLTRGGAWNTSTVRSATTENDLQTVQGRLVNLNAITNGPAVGFGLYVGSIATDAGGATVTWNTGGAASDGTQVATLNIWNLYNDEYMGAAVFDTSAPWNYASSTFRAANNQAGNAINILRGLDTKPAEVIYVCGMNTAAALVTFGLISIGLDSTTAQSNRASLAKVLSDATSVATPQAEGGSPASYYNGLPGLGKHIFTGIEKGDNVNNVAFGTSPTMMLSGKFRM